MQIQHMYLNQWSHEIKNSIDGAKFHGFMFLNENRAYKQAAITLKKCCLVVWSLEGVGIFPV